MISDTIQRTQLFEYDLSDLEVEAVLETPLWYTAMELQRAGRYAESLEQLDLLLKEDLSKLEQAWVLYACTRLFTLLARFDAAKASLDQAFALTDDPYLRVHLEFQSASVVFAEGQYGTAVETIQKLLERYSADELRSDPDYVDIYRSAMSTLGQASLGLGQYAEAAKALDAALSTAQEMPIERHGLFSRLGETFYHLGDYTRSHHYFTAALDEEQFVPKLHLSPAKTATIRYWLAFVANAQHDFSSARRELDAALTIVKDEQLRKNIETRRRALGD